MRLPVPLQTAIEEAANSLGLSQLIQAREELSRRYRTSLPGSSSFITTDIQRQSYVISRMPATYAALQASIKEIQKRGAVPIRSLLDLGAGPGTAMWAACSHFQDINSITLIEKDSALSSIGKQLARHSEYEAMQKADWIEGDLEKIEELPPHDLVILSYSIGELSPEKMESILEVSWKATAQLLLIIEPGTPVGFERIRLFRDRLISQGAHLIAPCPHSSSCPMEKGDWCHFPARVERSSLHRRIKGGTLGYEDEKFSYIAVAKSPIPPSPPRILREPGRHSGHIKFELCTSEGIQGVTISRKMGPLFKQARKAEWGETIG